MRQDESNGGFQLPGGILRNAQRGIDRRGLVHFRIAVGMTEAIEIKPPDVEAGFVQRIAPRLAVKAMGDRQRRRECRAMHIEHRAAPPKPGFLRWQEPQE